MTTQDKLADALRVLIEHCTVSDDSCYGTLSTSFVRKIAEEALAEHDAPDKCFCDRMYPDSSPSASCGDCPTRDYAPQPAPAPVHEGLWRCSQCGEPADAMSSRWRWSGKEWQHHHGAQVGHVNSRYFGSDAAPVQTSDDLVPYLQPTSEEIEASCNGSDAHQPAPAADGAGELPPLPEPTCLGFRNPCGITQLPDMGIYGYTADQVRACQRETIAALRQPVTLREVTHDDAKKAACTLFIVPAHALRHEHIDNMLAALRAILPHGIPAIASQQESRNAD